MLKKKNWKKVWGAVGFVVNLSQMIEYNIANILALDQILSAFDNQESMFVFEYKVLVDKTNSWYDKLIHQELGKVIYKSEKKKVFTDEFVKYLDDIREKRNYYIHHFFKDDLSTKKFQDSPKECLPELQELIGRMNAANEELVQIFSEMKAEVKMIY